MKRPEEVKEGAAGYAYAAIFNQIRTTIYYHVSWYKLNPFTKKYSFSHVICGHRGPGGHLGMSGSEASAEALRINIQQQVKK